MHITGYSKKFLKFIYRAVMKYKLLILFSLICFVFFTQNDVIRQDQSFQKNKEQVSVQMEQDMFKLAEFNSIH